MCFYRATTVKCSNVSGGLFVYPGIFYFRRSCSFEDALNRLCSDSDIPNSLAVGTGQLVPKSTRTLVNSYPCLVNSYLSQLVPKSTHTLVYL